LDAWYSFVERKLELSGMRDKLPWVPDSELADVLSFTQSEEALRDKIIHRWPGARPILSRYAPPLQTLEAAAQTGRLQCRQGAIVREIRVDSAGRVNGVVWIDHQTQAQRESSAPLVFLCASALESTRILLLSRSRQSSQGLGAASGVLGRHLMDHVVLSAEGVGAHQFSGHPPDDGRCLYLPRFDARAVANPTPGRGFGLQVYQLPVSGGQTYFSAFAFAEMTPREENRVMLDPNRRDAWGIPVLRIDCSHNESEIHLARDQTQALRELAEIAEVKLIRIDETPRPPGSAIHECGTARMGDDPSRSVLDPHNQCWEARGLYVTDASCFPSQGSQNPTLTILALTARACHHALGNTPTAVARPCQNSDGAD
jgi:choline dehydrogenase-like flavoprotein